jgi:putative SOS response-associated peptidase YedK
LRRAFLDGNKADANAIYEKLGIFSDDEVTLYLVSGFDHPTLFIYTNEAPMTPIVASWGLVPSWSENKESIWNKTLNARGETIFDKPAFKDSALNKRCILFLEGFCEHHHKTKKMFPYLITVKDKDLFAVAGLWNKWQDELGEMITTFSIVTTKANDLMAEIHNNPSQPEARMPLILTANRIEQWLNNELNAEGVQQLIQPLSDGLLSAYTVGPIRGGKALGNNESVTKELKYALLEGGWKLDLF